MLGCVLVYVFMAWVVFLHNASACQRGVRGLLLCDPGGALWWGEFVWNRQSPFLH